MKCKILLFAALAEITQTRHMEKEKMTAKELIQNVRIIPI